MFAKPSAHWLPSLYTWETTKFMLLVILRQFLHLLLSSQGTNTDELKAMTTRVESDSSQRFFQFLQLASSIALIAPQISAMNADFKPVFSAKQHKKSALWFLKMPPQDEVKELEAPSVLHFTQCSNGGCQKTSLRTVGLGGCKLTFKFFRTMNSVIDGEATPIVLLPVREVLDKIQASAVFQ
ncbi:unnamed protein product [Trifolium pratense]|uniref:Uncharacterized protein n=1 Tax=Trifolium pratense TaxID=57577 RepID=A0ACB0K921_TRIPR|nr:unnamed protein product [Trifolium pratense]